MLGQLIAAELIKCGYGLVILSRQSHKSKGQVSYVQWDPEGPITNIAGRFNAVINLCGSSINQRWNKAGKENILKSRTIPTRWLVDAINAGKIQTACYVGMSGTGIYPESDHAMDEQSGVATDFLGLISSRWEAASSHLKPEIRRVILRLGVILHPNAGFLAKLLHLCQWGLTSRIGDGRQIIAGLHHQDYVALIRFAIENENMHGTYNAVCEEGISNAALMHQLSNYLHKIKLPAAPKWVVALILGEKSELVIKSSWVSPAKLMKLGFTFKHPNATEAIRACLEAKSKKTEPSLSEG